MLPAHPVSPKPLIVPRWKLGIRGGKGGMREGECWRWISADYRGYVPCSDWVVRSLAVVAQIAA